MEAKSFLGIDWGLSKIGLATGSNESKIALPFSVVKNFKEVVDIISNERIDEIVIGKPVSISGSEKGYIDEYKKFVELLKRDISLPINFVDERLTSKQADSLVGDKKTKADQDAIAAMLILQSYFDKQ